MYEMFPLHGIDCIVVIDSYGLWINRSHIIIFSTNTLWQDWLLLL